MRTSEWEPGIDAVTPRIGSVNSCSGEGRAKGERSTRAAAQRIVATEVCTSLFDNEKERLESGAAGTGEKLEFVEKLEVVEKELPRRRA